jgi:hypothetical protein
MEQGRPARRAAQYLGSITIYFWPFVSYVLDEKFSDRGSAYSLALPGMCARAIVAHPGVPI